MKRFFATVVFCAALLTVLTYFLFPVTRAAENPLAALLNLPAPPPPNPEVTLPPIEFDEDFFNRSKPPADDASIEYLMAYWKQQAQDFNEIRYKIYPSDKVLDRLFTEFAKDPDKLTEYLSILPSDRRSGDFVKEIYNRFSSGDENQRQKRSQLRRWLKYNTDQFSNELAREANKVADTDGYVSHHRELVALARVDWDKAGPIANRLYNNPGQRASRTAALWALYAHAIENSPGDTDRYRDELKATVEDKSLPDGIRDLALDALSLEKEWSGRDDWYMKLMEDDTMLELGSYTGLTTLISASPDEKYIDRMIALLDSENISVRSAAARNLVMKIDVRPDVVKALLPWIADRKWLLSSINGREQVLQVLGRTKMPEAVPLLIAALDEKMPRYTSSYANAANAAANAAQAAANAVAMAANYKGSVSDTYELRSETYSVANNANAAGVYTGDSYPLRYWAISALSFQEDPRAVPALKRLLGDANATYENSSLVTAIYNCGGFSLSEQVDAIEDVAKNADEVTVASNAAVGAVNRPYSGIPNYSLAGVAPSDIRRMLGLYLAQQYNVHDDTARAVVDRITSLDRSDPKTASAMRKIVMRWYAPAVYMLLLRDLKQDKAPSEAIVRLLSVRKELREKQQADVSDVRTGTPTAVGISACLFEDVGDYQGILDGPSDEAKTALLACGRLIRAPLSIEKVAQNLKSKNALLALAAERYLESEDSLPARQIVLSLHPNEAKILGATTAFYPDPAFDGSFASSDPIGLSSLFASVSGYFSIPQGYIGSEMVTGSDTAEIEKRLQEEVKKDPDLLGVYNWEKNYVHIYKDRAVVSWEDDPARYRERTMTKDEFENFKGLISHFKADELPPFLGCTSCTSRQLLMLGRNGGRRVFVRVNSLPQFFAELDRTFDDLKRPPSTIKYWASKAVPGLEVLFSDERLDAKSVWKNGADFRLLVADKVQRQEIDNQLEEYAESNSDDDEAEIRTDNASEDEDDEQPKENKVEAERTRREYENYAWSSFSAGALTGSATQPVDAPYIPLKDNFRIAATDGQWKARVGTIEVRASSEGLFKIAAGQMTELRKGDYRDPVVTPNGRWVIVTKYDDEDGPKLFRINLATNKEIAVESEERAAYRAVAYVPSINRVLVGPFNEDYYDYYQTDEGSDGDAVEFSWLDPDTGVVVPTRGEVRPLAQQTWRGLQPGPGPFEFWAALPKSDDTVVGIYNTKTFTFKTLVTLPKITFDSEDIWVDASEGRAYFVYEGHLLGMPLKAGR